MGLFDFFWSSQTQPEAPVVEERLPEEEGEKFVAQDGNREAGNVSELEDEEVAAQLQEQNGTEERYSEADDEEEDPEAQLRQDGEAILGNGFDGTEDEPKPKKKRLRAKKSGVAEDESSRPKLTRSKKQPQTAIGDHEEELPSAVAEKPKSKKGRQAKRLVSPEFQTGDLANWHVDKEAGHPNLKTKQTSSSSNVSSKFDYLELAISDDEETMAGTNSKAKRRRNNSNGPAPWKRKSKASGVGFATDDYDKGDAVNMEVAVKERRVSNRSTKSTKSMAIPLLPDEDEDEENDGMEMLHLMGTQRIQEGSSKKFDVSQSPGPGDIPDGPEPDDVAPGILEQDSAIHPLEAAIQASQRRLVEQTAEIDPGMTEAERRQEMKRLERNHLSRVTKAKRKFGPLPAVHDKDEIAVPNTKPALEFTPHEGSTPGSPTALSINPKDPVVGPLAQDENDKERARPRSYGEDKAVTENDATPSRNIAKTFKKRTENVVAEVEREDEPSIPSAKALGKRKAVDKPNHNARKRTKAFKDSGTPNRDLRDMLKSTPSESRFQTPATGSSLSVPLASVAVELWDKTWDTIAREESSSADLREADPAEQSASGHVQSPRTITNVQPSRADFSDRMNTEESEFQPEELHMPQSGRKRRLPVDVVNSSSSKGNPLASRKANVKTKATSLPKQRAISSGSTPGSRGTSLAFNEAQSIIAAVESYGELHDLTQFDVNGIVQQNMKPGAQTKEGKQFWKFISEQVPDVPVGKLSFFCRRKFHNFEGRGTWTKQQDQELRQVYEAHPKKWSRIAKIINRHPEDVRDRWRNYLVCGDNLRKDRWEADEEAELKNVVEECMWEFQTDLRKKGRDPTPEHLESLLDWNVVSARLGHTRSRLQCMNKWKAFRATRAMDEKNGVFRHQHKKLMFPSRQPDEVDTTSELPVRNVASDDDNGEGPSTCSEKAVPKTPSPPKSVLSLKHRRYSATNVASPTVIRRNGQSPTTSNKKKFRERMRAADQSTQESVDEPQSPADIEEVMSGLNSVRSRPKKVVIRMAKAPLKVSKRSKLLSDEKALESDPLNEEIVLEPAAGKAMYPNDLSDSGEEYKDVDEDMFPRAKNSYPDSKKLPDAYSSLTEEVDADGDIIATTEADDALESRLPAGRMLGLFEAALQPNIIRAREEAKSRSRESGSVDLDDGTPVNANSFDDSPIYDEGDEHDFDLSSNHYHDEPSDSEEEAYRSSQKRDTTPFPRFKAAVSDTEELKAEDPDDNHSSDSDVSSIPAKARKRGRMESLEL